MGRLLLALLCLPVLAQPTGSGNQRLNLNELLAEALRNNPEILAAQKRYEAARQRPAQASSLPDPMFSPGWSANGRPWPGALLGTEPTSNVGFVLSQEIPAPGKRRLLADMAVKEAEAEFHEYQQTRLGVVSRMKQAHYRRAWAFESSAVLQRNAALLRRLLEIAVARYAAGQATQPELFRLQTQISILETKRLQTEREKAVREAEMVSLAHRRPGTTLYPPDPLLPQELDTPAEELIREALRNSPQLRRDQTGIERAELAVNLARKQYYPDITLSGGYFNMGRMPDMYQFRADIKVPLYFFRKQRAGLAEQAHNLARSRRSYEASGQALVYRVREDALLAETSLQLARLYRNTVIPQAGLAVESSLASYQTGGSDFLSVFMNVITVVEYELNYYEELQNLYLALSRLEEMTGLALIR